MQRFTKLADLDVKGRRVFVRVDFNVPLKENADGTREVADAARIEGALPTLRWLMDKGARCIVASHMGRPKGKRVEQYSLEPVASKLSDLLGRDVVLTEDCVGDGPRGLSVQARNGEVLLVENLRYHAGEEKNSPEFANDLRELCDLYVTDAFGALHRAHASTSALPKLFQPHERAIGLLVEKELEYLEPLRSHPPQPFVLLMGGSKVSDKIGVLEHLLPKLNKVLIGGAMAYAFLKAKGVLIGDSLCDSDQVRFAEKILKGAEARKIDVLLPCDHLVVKSFNAVDTAKVTPNEIVPEGWMAVDIGPQTVERFGAALVGAETVFWNGPLGVFEKPEYAKGTFEIAKKVAASSAKKLAGGGDVAAAIEASGCQEQFDFISTGGGATLEYLEGKNLPGLSAVAIPESKRSEADREA